MTFHVFKMPGGLPGDAELACRRLVPKRGDLAGSGSRQAMACAPTPRLVAALHLSDEFNQDRALSYLGSGTKGFAV